MGGHRHASQGQWRQGHELEGTLPGLDHFGSPDGLDTRPASCRPLSLSAFQREHRPPPRPVPPSCCCPDTRRAPDVPGPWGHRTRWGLPSILPQLLGARTSFTQEPKPDTGRSEEHTSELQSLMRISYAVFGLKKKNKTMTK